jgi:hypothetical protein
MLLTYFKKRKEINGSAKPGWYLTVKCYEIKYILGCKNVRFVCTAYNELIIDKLPNVNRNNLFRVDAETYAYQNDFFLSILKENLHVEYLD